MLTIVVLLSVRNTAAFDQFEKQAAQIMQRHGGRIDTAFRPASVTTEGTQKIDEVHVLKFPSHASFEAYRNDERLLELASLREQAISHTDVYLPPVEID